MKKYLLIILVFLFSTNVIAEEKKEIIKSSLSAGEIEDFIEKEREILRGKFKVDLPKKFIAESSTLGMRFGNQKAVLNLNGLSFSGEDLRGVIFTMSSMQKTNLQNAQLQHSDFVNVDFTGADLQNADFSKADLSNAVFEAVNLKGAIFEGANLFGARFIKVKDLEKNELDSLKNRTNSYVNLEREPLPDYY